MTGGYSPYFGVAHKAIAETHGQTVCVKGTETMFLGNRVHVCRVCGGNSIAFHVLFWCDTPSIVNAVIAICELYKAKINTRT